jgi:hypothetical protein
MGLGGNRIIPKHPLMGSLGDLRYLLTNLDDFPCQQDEEENFSKSFAISGLASVKLSTPRPEGRGLLRVDPERRFCTPPSKAGLGAAEWVNPKG